MPRVNGDVSFICGKNFTLSYPPPKKKSTSIKRLPSNLVKKSITSMKRKCTPKVVQIMHKMWPTFYHFSAMTTCRKMNIINIWMAARRKTFRSIHNAFRFACIKITLNSLANLSHIANKIRISCIVRYISVMSYATYLVIYLFVMNFVQSTHLSKDSRPCPAT